MAGYESLHNHTIDSDGTLTHLEVLKTAEKLGYGVIAFTDHDMVPTPEKIEQLRKDYAGPVKWTIGTELSTGLPEEFGGVERGMVHVLGLFIDPTNQALLDHFQKLEDSRIERMKHMVKHLRGIGFKLTEDDVLGVTEGNVISSWHVVKAVQTHPENLELEKKLLEQMKEAAKTDAEMREKYETMVTAGVVQYPYRLYMKASSFIPMPRAETYNTLLSMDDSVKLIRDAGGVAVLAHWYFHTKFYKEAKLEATVKAGLLDGLETATDNTTFDGNVDKEIEFLQELIKQNNLLETMGSDSHYIRDLEHFAKTPAAERSIGHTQKIIDRIKPNLEWSNF